MTERQQAGSEGSAVHCGAPPNLIRASLKLPDLSVSSLHPLTISVAFSLELHFQRGQGATGFLVSSANPAWLTLATLPNLRKVPRPRLSGATLSSAPRQADQLPKVDVSSLPELITHRKEFYLDIEANYHTIRTNPSSSDTRSNDSAAELCRQARRGTLRTFIETRPEGNKLPAVCHKRSQAFFAF